MDNNEKTIVDILSGNKDKNIGFSDMCNLLKTLGFLCRVKGDHYIFTRDGVIEIINIQPEKAKVKPYQVKQIRKLILKYTLGGKYYA